MANFLDLKLALRFFRSRRKGALTRFISFASTCGIAIGVFAAIVGFSAMNGFEYELENRVLSIIPSAQLNSSRPYFQDVADIERILNESPHIVATAPAIEQRAILSANRAFAPLVIAGIDPYKEQDVIAIQRFTNTQLISLCPNFRGYVFGMDQECADCNITDAAVASDDATALGGPGSPCAVDFSTPAAPEDDAADSATADAAAADTLENEEEEQLAASAARSEDAAAEQGAPAEQNPAAAQDAPAAQSTEAQSRSLAAQSAEPVLPTSNIPRIIIGSGIAKKLQVDVGDMVDVVTLDNTATVDSINAAHTPEQEASTVQSFAGTDFNRTLRTPQKHKALVVGIIHIGGQLDTTVALMHYTVLKELASLQGPNVIHIRTDNLQDTNNIVFNATSGKIKESAYLVTWMSTQGKLYHDIQMVRQILFVAMFLVLAVACFNIVSNLLMMVGEKRREIAILLTMGMKPHHVVRTFALMGLISGMYGSLLGLVSGVVVSLVVTPITSSFRDWFGFDLLNEDVYFINFIPCRLELSDVLIVLAISLLMSLGAALYPALRASRIKPARELNL